MMIEVLKSKIHCARVTEANLNYMGSITIDEDLLDAANMIAGEKVYIADNNNGERFEVLNWNADRNYAYVYSLTTGQVGYVNKSALVKEGEMAYHQTATITSEMGYLYLYDRPSSSYGENLGRY